MLHNKLHNAFPDRPYPVLNVHAQQDKLSSPTVLDAKFNKLLHAYQLKWRTGMEIALAHQDNNSSPMVLDVNQLDKQQQHAQQDNNMSTDTVK